ncbi:hypothetical protein [Litoreibacter arenae]|uniref:Uncharacterized protein n=1 Tax=Litoreibacter arenae DSM 19593 TaxID=1123360 RepID=S9REH3_9RHOB|nr:hypothetical protein [Litoreibacter arenae]EPX76525.1 hypothetical protein thalar_03655 [Litoreibacter arenae DSM 19593]
MKPERTEAAAIARLYGQDPHKVIGWIYHWNTGELTFLWNTGEREVHFIEPNIDRGRFCQSTPSNIKAFAKIEAAKERPILKL